MIESRKCIELLRDYDPEAAAWWTEFAPTFLEPKRFFVFPAECCDLVGADRMANAKQPTSAHEDERS